MIHKFEQFINEGLFSNNQSKFKEFISKANSLKFDDKILSADMASNALDSLNKLNILIDDILNNKDIIKDKEIANKISNIKKNVGSNISGMNRSKDDHKCNPSELYLGNINGLFTKDLNFWLSGSVDKEDLETVGNQLNNWINNNIKSLVTILTNLL